MNDLERIFYANTENLIHKWKHYFEIYDRHFSRFRGSDVTVLEMGVGQGGSLRMWRSYFGPRAKIVGVDINPECATLAGDQIQILLANQDDRESLRELKAKVPHVDILIDDGGHTMQQQINTFEELFAHVDANGVYLCEDLHTSYWPDWGGGFRKDGSFIEFGKRLIDQLHAWHSTNAEELRVTDFTRTAHSLHFYDSILAVEKRPMQRPAPVQTGAQKLAPIPAPRNFPKLAE
jgi:hypothetical protein